MASVKRFGRFLCYLCVIVILGIPAVSQNNKAKSVQSIDLTGRDGNALAASAAWNVHAGVMGKSGGGIQIAPPNPIPVGSFAWARYVGKDLSWVGYETLVLDIHCDQPGPVKISLSEYDGVKREDFTVALDEVPQGFSTHEVRLSAEPDGDLIPSSLEQDGIWNPDEKQGVQILLAEYPGGFIIEGMRLECTAADIEEEN